MEEEIYIFNVLEDEHQIITDHDDILLPKTCQIGVCGGENAEMACPDCEFAACLECLEEDTICPECDAVLEEL